MKLPLVAFRSSRNNTLTCTDKTAQMQNICAHNPPPLGKAGGSLRVIVENAAVTDLLVSLVWAIRKGKGKEEEKWQKMRRFRGRAFLISSQADRQKPAPRLSHGGDALWNRQGVLWLAHLVSRERRGRARLKLRKWDWESGAGLFSSLKPAPFTLNWRRGGRGTCCTNVWFPSIQQQQLMPPESHSVFHSRSHWCMNRIKYPWP